MLKKTAYMLLLLVKIALLEGSEMDTLISGNKTFIQSGDFESHKKGQTPNVTMLSCSDSRVSPELIFEQDLGQIFNVRLAGNVVDTIGLESIEFGVLQLKTPVLAILGHTKCGAVEAAIKAYKEDTPEKKLQIIQEILPAVRTAAKKSKNASQLWDEAVKQNVLDMKDKLLQKSEKIRKEVNEGRVEVVLGVYDISTGKVDWFER